MVRKLKTLFSPGDLSAYPTYNYRSFQPLILNVKMFLLSCTFEIFKV